MTTSYKFNPFTKKLDLVGSGGTPISGIQTINSIGPDGGGNYILESTDGSVVFTPIANGENLSVPGAVGAVKSFDIDVGGPITPVAGVITLNGIGGNQTVTSGAGEIGVNNLYWQTSYVVDPSTTPGLDATYQTIQAAINAAVAANVNANIFIRTGTYTENLTLATGVNLMGVADGRSGEFGATKANITEIIGNHTLNSTGGVLGIQNLTLLANNTSPIFTLTSNGICEVGISSCLVVNQSTGPIATVDNTGVGTFTLFAFQNSLGATSGTEGIILTGGGSIALGLAQVSTVGNVINVQGSPAIFNIQNCNLTGQTTAPFSIITFSSTIGFMGLSDNTFDGYSGILGTGGSAGIQSLNNLWSCQAANGFYVDTSSGASNITYNYVNDQADGSAKNIDPAVNLDPLSWRPRATAGNSTTAYAGTASFDSTTFTVTDGFVQLTGGPGPAVLTITPDSGGPIAPVGGTIDLNGIGGNVTGTNGAGEVYVDNEFWISSFVVDPSTTPGTRGSFQTIQSAMTAANAAGGGQVIIRPNVNPYVENLNFLPNVELQGSRMDPFITANGGFGVTIQGNHTMNDGGGNLLVACTDLAFIAVTGTNFTISATTGTVAFDFEDCGFGNEDNAGVVFDMTSTGTVFGIVKNSDVGSNGIIANVGPACDINFFNCFSLSAQSAGFNVTGGAVSLAFSPVQAPIGFNVSAGTVDLETAPMDTNTTGVLFAGGGTVHANNVNWQCNGVSGFYIDGTGGTYDYINDQIDGSATQINPAIIVNNSVWRPRATAGNSTTAYAGTASFNSTDFTVVDGFVSVKDPVIRNYTNVTNAMSPYTVLSTDDFISCDLSGGPITLLFPNVPTTGETWTVKDRLGLSNTNNLTLSTVGGVVTIDTVTSYVIDTDFQGNDLLFNSANYEVF